ncbi:unnamed protein product, partial [Nesidiocoris tenuis]
MPFGLCNAPATFQRLMRQLLKPLIDKQVVEVYLDDVLVHTPSFSKHLVVLEEVFGLLRSANLKLNVKKCEFLRRSATYLGHLITRDGIKTDPKKVESIVQWPKPTTVKELRSFVGLCSYYREFIPKLAEIAKPLYRAQNHPGELQWNEDCQNAFAKLKELLQNAPVLAHVRPDCPFVIDADASDVGIGAVLSQVQDGQEKVVAFFSRCLSRAERNYCVTRKELLSVVKAVQWFGPYGLDNGKLTIRTDHSSLRWLMNFMAVDGQLARWLEQLASYDIDIRYRPGQAHGNADAMSRRPCAGNSCKYCERRDELAQQNKLQPKDFSALRVQLEPEWGDAEVREKQENDPHVGPAYQWVAEGVKPSWEIISHLSPDSKAYWSMFDSLEISEGILCRRWESPNGMSYHRQIIIPSSMRKAVFSRVHGLVHFGEKRTLAKLREFCYWVGIHRDVRMWCRECATCGKRQGGKKTAKAPMQLYQ